MGLPPAPKSSIRRRLCSCLFMLPEHAPKLYSDKAYDFVDWQWHQNAAWRHRLEPLMFFVVASGFIWQLAHVLIISILCGLYNVYLVPLGWPNYSSQLNTAFGMVTTCLSLLLVFRTNSSYSRWWEARMLWGSVVNLSRNYARQMILWAPPERTHVARMGVRWMAVAVHVMRAHLRAKHTGRVTQEAGHLLTLDEFAWLAQWRSAPQGAAHVLGWAAANLGVHYQREQVLQELIVTFINDLGACERILRTPMPTAYTSHTSRFVIIYITISPILLWSVLQWATPICSLMIAFLLLGTENIGVQIEEPFKVLPLDSICNTIENSIRDMEKRHYGSCSMDELRQVDAMRLAHEHDEDAMHARYAEEGAAAAAHMEALFAGKLAPLQDPSAREMMHPPRGKPPVPPVTASLYGVSSRHSGGGKQPPAPAAAAMPGEVQMTASATPFAAHAYANGGPLVPPAISGQPSQHGSAEASVHTGGASAHGLYASHGEGLYASHPHVSFGVLPVLDERSATGARAHGSQVHGHSGHGWMSQELLSAVGNVGVRSPPGGTASGGGTQHGHGHVLPQAIGKLVKQFTLTRQASNMDDADPERELLMDDEAPAVPESPRSRSAHFREGVSHTKRWNKHEITLYGGEFPEGDDDDGDESRAMLAGQKGSSHHSKGK